MKKRAWRFFRLADQYSETAQLLLKTMIRSGNSNVAVDSDYQNVLQKAENAAIKSDMYLFIPAIFNCLQSTELFAKGILLLNGEEFKKKHSVEEILKKINEIYTKNHSLYTCLNDFYTQQIKIIENYQKKNDIKDINVLYTSLRYPESPDGKKVNDYYPLICNGDIGIAQFRILSKQLQSVKEEVLKEYNSK